jgi:hypothetical protein
LHADEKPALGATARHALADPTPTPDASRQCVRTPFAGIAVWRLFRHSYSLFASPADVFSGRGVHIHIVGST